MAVLSAVCGSIVIRMPQGDTEPPAMARSELMPALIAAICFRSLLAI